MKFIAIGAFVLCVSSIVLQIPIVRRCAVTACVLLDPDLWGDWQETWDYIKHGQREGK